MIGFFPGRSIRIDKYKYIYTSQGYNDYNMILTGAAIFHRAYLQVFFLTLS